MYPQGVQSPQALTNRGAIRSHTRTRRFLGTFLRSVPLLVARRGDSVGQRTLLVAFKHYPCPSASHGASRSEWNDERIEADRSERPSYSFLRRPASDNISAYIVLDLPTHSVQPDDDGAVFPPLPTALLVRSRGLRCSLREGA